MPRPDFAGSERLMQEIERESRERTERVKGMAREAGRPELADELDERLKLIESGVTGARSTWHSISDAQRRVLILCEGGPTSLRRMGNSRYDVVSPLGSRAIGIRLATVRNLAARGLLEWTGGAFDPEASAVPTERASFVLKHGRPAPGQHFSGYRP